MNAQDRAADFMRTLYESGELRRRPRRHHVDGLALLFAPSRATLRATAEACATYLRCGDLTKDIAEIERILAGQLGAGVS